MTIDGTIRLATRGSDLALRQAGSVQAGLEDRRHDVELVEVETEGDRIRDELIHRLGKTGAFVRSLDETVLAGELDAAVHSMKDMPTDQPADLVVAGVPERAPAGDVLVTPDGTDLDDLPEGAVVGTSSLRRKAQVQRKRSDLVVESLRGNVDTRIEKLLAPSLQREHERRLDAERPDGSERDAEGVEDGVDAGGSDGEFEESAQEWFESLTPLEQSAMEREVDVEYDAIVLAEAGLDRAGLLHHLDYQRLSTTDFVPAPGQGAIAVTARDDAVAEAIHDAIDHPRTRVETTVERAVLAELGGGCVAPIGVHAVVQGESVHTTAQVLNEDGSEVVAATRDLDLRNHREAARAFARDLDDQGAGDLVDAAKRETGDGDAGLDDGEA